MSVARDKLSHVEPLGLGRTAAARLRPAAGKGDALGWHRRFRALASELRQRFRSRGAHALELDLPERTVRFRTIEEFDFALSSKTEYPVERIADLIERPPADLRKVATHIRQVEKRFAQVLTESIQHAGMVGELMRELEIKHFTQDHGWRDLIDALNQAGPEHDEFKRLALVKYMQYLGSRQDVLRSIYLDKTRGTPASEDHPPTSTPGSSQDTAIWGLSSMPGVAPPPGLVAMPRGETLTVRVEPNQAVEIELAGHPFRLYGGRHFYLIDESGGQLRLRPGKNMVGRHGDCDVVVDSRLRAVSRRHLIIETVGTDTAMLTDVSAHGTSIHERYVGN